NLSPDPVDLSYMRRDDERFRSRRAADKDRSAARENRSAACSGSESDQPSKASNTAPVAAASKHDFRACRAEDESDARRIPVAKFDFAGLASSTSKFGPPAERKYCAKR